MAQRKFRTNIVVSYEPDEAGWVRASLPAMPELVTAGVSRDDAREMAIDALMQLLSLEPERQDGGDYERVRLDVSTSHAAQRDTNRAKAKPSARSSSDPSRAS